MFFDGLYKCIKNQTKIFKTRKRKLIMRIGVKDGEVERERGNKKYLFGIIRN